MLRVATLSFAIVLLVFTACSPSSSDVPNADSQASFEELQERGKSAMGVDQYTSTHLFDALPDGGRIELQRDSADSAGVATVRAHLADIAKLFKAGDFRIPGIVHNIEVPGTKVMAERKDHIAYSYSDLPRGGQVRITTTDAEAIKAIHEFMAFQRSDHRAGGHEH